MGADDLGAVAPICLIAIVFLRIMAGGDVHAALASEFADGETQLRSRTEAVEEIHLYAVGRENISHDFSELAAVVAHVVSNSHTDLGKIGESLVEIVGQSLGGCTHGIYVHAVGACSHDAAQTTGAELEIFVERFDKFRFVVGIEHTFYFCLCFRIIAIGEPSFGFCGHLLDEFAVAVHIVGVSYDSLFRVHKDRLLTSIIQMESTLSSVGQCPFAIFILRGGGRRAGFRFGGRVSAMLRSACARGI